MPYAPDGDDVLTLVHGQVDAERIAFCLGRPDDDGPTRFETPPLPAGGLGYGESFTLSEAEKLDFENDALERTRYGISHDDPGITAPGNCRYDACVEVPKEFVASGNAMRTTLPGGRYASTHFEGTVEQIVGAWAALLRDWLPGSGLQLDSRPCFEHYPKGSRFDPETGVFDCNICIPVPPL